MPRKAETVRKAVELERSKTPLLIGLFVVVGIAATAGAIAWGTSDAGQIDVSATVLNSNQTENGEEGGTPLKAATEVHRSMPNGGLVPQGGDVPAPPAPEPAVDETSTTTTEAGSEETTTTDEVEQTDEAVPEGGGETVDTPRAEVTEDQSGV
jgi:hypothetical protein